MKAWQKISTITFSLVAAAAMIFLFVFFFAPKTSTSPESNPSHAATETLPTSNWVDYAVQPAVGSGTEADPWHISTAEELAYLAKTFTTSSNFYLYLEADIDLGAHLWTPIGNGDKRIRSSYLYGQNHTISNLYIQQSIRGAGLFGWIERGGEFSDINFENVQVTGGEVVGTVIGWAGHDTVADSMVITLNNINIKSGVINGSADVGGLVGYSSQKVGIYKCTNNAKIVATGSDTGGICGYLSETKIEDCKNYAVITGTKNVGGIVGADRNGEMQNCINEGNIAGTQNVGGLVGWSFGLIINECISRGEIQGSSMYIGGLIGYCSVSTNMSDCVNFGAINSGNDPKVGSSVGGVVGYITSAKIINCINKGTVEGKSSVDPIVGSRGSSATITNCISVEGLWTDYAAQPAIGSGTADDPWHVSTAEELAYLAKTATTTSDFYLYLDNDVDLLLHKWVPIGNTDSRINSIHFYGQNHNIDNLYVNTDVAGAGLIGGLLNSSEITDLTFTNADIISTVASGDFSDAGVLAGHAPRTVFRNIHINSGSVKGNLNCVAGMAGRCWTSNTIENCSNAADVTGDRYKVGGIVGDFYQSEMYDCKNTGTIIGKLDRTGGIVGHCDASLVKNCVNEGDVTGPLAVGGIVGYLLDSSSVIDCSATGTITNSDTSTSPNRTGGIAGDFTDNSLIRNCSFKNGTINAKYSGGGICGSMALNSTIDGCKVENTTIVVATNNAGGICGAINLTNCVVQNCVVRSTKLDDASVYNVGGIVGWAGDNGHIISNCRVEENCIITGKIQVGGILGMQKENGNMKIEFCVNKAPVTGERVGGIVGQFDGGGSVSTSTNYATVTGPSTTNTSAGGIIGRLINGNVSGSINVGNVTKSNNVGGIAGYITTGDISASHNYGNLASIENTSGTNVGGIAGLVMGGTVNISNCSNNGEVSGTGTGGLVGACTGDTTTLDIIECYNAGIIKAIKADNYYLGGFIGYLNSVKSVNITRCLANCYIDTPSTTNSNTYLGAMVGITATPSNTVTIKGSAAIVLNDYGISLNDPTALLFYGTVDSGNRSNPIEIDSSYMMHRVPSMMNTMPWTVKYSTYVSSPYEDSFIQYDNYMAGAPIPKGIFWGTNVFGSVTLDELKTAIEKNYFDTAFDSFEEYDGSVA